MTIKKILNFYYKNKIVIFPVLVSISGLILIVLVIYPQLKNLLADQKDYRNLSDQSKILEVKADELQSLSKENLQAQLNVALAALPAEQDYTTVIGLIQQLVAKDNFDLLALDFGTTSTTGKSFEVNLQLTGPEDSVNQLFTDIESSPRAMKLSNVDSSVGLAGSGNVNLDLTLEIFFSPLPASIGAVDSQINTLSDSDRKLLNQLASMMVGSVTTTSELNLLPKGKPDPFE